MLHPILEPFGQFYRTNFGSLHQTLQTLESDMLPHFGSFMFLQVNVVLYTGVEDHRHLLVSLKIHFVHASSYPRAVLERGVFVPPFWSWKSTHAPLIRLCSFI